MKKIAHFTLAACTALVCAGALPVRAQPWQTSEFEAPRTTESARAAFLEEERENIAERLAIPLSDREQAEDRWPGAFWATALINEPETPRVREAIEEALADFADLSPNFQRVITQSVNTLYPGEYIDEMISALYETSDPRAFTIAAHYITRGQPSDTLRLNILRTMVLNFPDWQEDGRLRFLFEHLRPRGLTTQNPPYVDLFRHDFDGKPVIFSIQRLDRNFGGRAIIRDADGNFLRDRQTGSTFSVPQIALSRTNMPGTVTYGNSPQGIYAITGTGTATNQFIGPTPYLWSKVPFEASVGEFFHDDSRADEQWSLDLYKSLLPESWREYAWMHEAYYAGMAGRSQMIAHGTTINPEFYAGESYYPFTPSAGCITTYERWSGETGQLEESGQVELLNAFYEVSPDMTGYLVVVEMHGVGPVGPDLVEALMQAIGQ